MKNNLIEQALETLNESRISRDLKKIEGEEEVEIWWKDKLITTGKLYDAKDPDGGVWGITDVDTDWQRIFHEDDVNRIKGTIIWVRYKPERV
jgi:hypothetical protein